MKLRKVFACVLGVLACSVVSINCLSCDSLNGERPYPPSSCLTLSDSTNTATSSQANANCPTQLATFEQDEQFDTLSRYVEVLLKDSSTSYWIGYRYNASDVLVDYNDLEVSSQSPALNSDNYATGISQSPEMDGTCVAIGLDPAKSVKLFRVTCGSSLPYICSTVVSAPTITSVTTSTTRFLSPGSSITLTCSASNNDSPLTWRRDGSVVTSTPSVLTIDDSQGTLTVESFDGVTASYECVAESRAGRVVSEAVVITNGGSDSQAPTIAQISSTSNSVQFGTSVNVTCTFTTANTATVEWFINGELDRTIDLSGSETESVLEVKSFSEDGVYQCRLSNDNNDNSVMGLRITGQAGSPGPVTFPIALPDSQSEIFISWLFPVDLNVLDPLLLRYQVYYQQGNNFDENSAQSTGILQPLLRNGEISPNGAVEHRLTGLNPGSMYMVTVRVHSGGFAGDLAGDLAIVNTYGNVPSKSVDNLKVLRTQDNKTLFADWDDLKLLSPEGPVSRYLVQYRDSNKDDAINEVFLAPKYSYLVVTPVENAQDYQVRVSAGVIVKRDPLEYNYGPFTDWLVVQGITPTVPPVPPTGGLLPIASVIAVAVVVPVLVIGLIVLILVLGIVCHCLQRRNSGGYSHRKRLDSQAASLKPEESSELPEKALNTPV